MLNFSTVPFPNNVPLWPIAANFQLVLTSTPINGLSSFTFSTEDINKIIQGLDPNKTQGHNNISICTLQICCCIIFKPLDLIFSLPPSKGSFPSEWKKGNIVPFHKKVIDKT